MPPLAAEASRLAVRSVHTEAAALEWVTAASRLVCHMGRLVVAEAVTVVTAVVEATRPAYRRLASVQAIIDPFQVVRAAVVPFRVALATDRVAADPRATSWVCP